jgi:hypothetical protein
MNETFSPLSLSPSPSPLLLPSVSPAFLLLVPLNFLVRRRNRCSEVFRGPPVVDD